MEVISSFDMYSFLSLEDFESFLRKLTFQCLPFRSLAPSWSV